MIWDFIGPLVETSTNASQEDRTENSGLINELADGVNERHC
jgi:hypothetical protein